MRCVIHALDTLQATGVILQTRQPLIDVLQKNLRCHSEFVFFFFSRKLWFVGLHLESFVGQFFFRAVLFVFFSNLGVFVH